MMNCASVQQLLYEGRFPLEVERHLEACSACDALRVKLSALDANIKYQVRTTDAYDEYRKQLILQKVRYSQPKIRIAAEMPWLRRGILAACLATLLIVPAQKILQLKADKANSLIPFEIGKIDQSVQLKWKGDPQRIYRVYKGVNPKDMRPIGELRGLQWVDASAQASLVFYKIEAL